MTFFILEAPTIIMFSKRLLPKIKEMQKRYRRYADQPPSALPKLSDAVTRASFYVIFNSETGQYEIHSKDEAP